MLSDFQDNLYYGDNLNILREYIKGGFTDLIYPDPPFQSNQSCNGIFKERNGTKSRVQIIAFEDTWQGKSENKYEELVEIGYIYALTLL